MQTKDNYDNIFYYTKTPMAILAIGIQSIQIILQKVKRYILLRTFLFVYIVYKIIKYKIVYESTNYEKIHFENVLGNKVFPRIFKLAFYRYT